MIVSATGAGASVTVTTDYVASSTTANSHSVAGVVLTAGSSGVDIDMSSAGGTFGYTIPAAAGAASTQKGSSKTTSLPPSTSMQTALSATQVTILSRVKMELTQSSPVLVMTSSTSKLRNKLQVTA